MTVVYDTATEQQRSASAAVTTFTHVAGAGTKGILVGFVRGGAATTITNVSYGGTSLVKYAEAADTVTEPGEAEWWFAPHTTTGSQTVSYAPGTIGSNIHAVAITITGAGTPYVIGSQTKAQNTTSHSVSLTTGYVSGMAFGAFYGGAATPASLSYSTDRVIVHDWDMGAFYSEFFRHAAATAPGAGTGGVIGFGGDAPTSDDLAFAAVYITDGATTIGSPAAVAAVAGLTPTLVLTEPSTAIEPTPGTLTVQCPVPPALFKPLNTHEPTLLTILAQPVGLGALAAAGQIATLAGESGVEGTAMPGAGALEAQGRAAALLADARAEPTTGAIATAGLGAGLLGALTQPVGLGALSALGLEPGISGPLNQHIPGLWKELRQAAGLGALTAEGRTPSLTSAGLALPSAGRIATAGLTPEEWRDLLQAGDTGLIGVQGLAAGLHTSLTQQPTAGALTLDGRDVTVAGENQVPGTAEPTAGTLTAEGRAAALLAERAQAVGLGALAFEGRAAGTALVRAQPVGLGALTLEGQVATLAGEDTSGATALPGTGAIEAQGRAATLASVGLAAPTVGAVAVSGQVPGIAGPLNTHVPGLLTELRQSATTGALTLDGQAPTVAAESGEASAAPGLGALEVQGRAASLLPYLSAAALPDAGAVTLEGRIAAEWRELKITLSKEYPFPVAGGASPGVGYLQASGVAPTARTEMTVQPSIPTAAGDTSEMPPTLLRTGTVSPAVATLGVQGLSPTTQKFVVIITQFIEPLTGLLTVEYPALEVSVQAVRPEIATLTLDGLAINTFSAIQPGLGALTLDGLEVTSRVTSDPYLATLALEGHAPDLLKDLRVEPGIAALELTSPAPGFASQAEVGAIAVAGLTPDLYAELIVTPATGALGTAGQAADEARDALAEGSPGLITLEGLAPFVVRYAGDSVLVEPSPDTLTVQGHAPTIASGEALGGSLIKRRRRGRVPAPIETSATATVVVALEPDIAAHYDEPPDMLGGVDTRRQAAEVAEISSRVAQLEAESARRARMRREEEELLQILLRVA